MKKKSSQVNFCPSELRPQIRKLLSKSSELSFVFSSGKKPKNNEEVEKQENIYAEHADACRYNFHENSDTYNHTDYCEYSDSIEFPVESFYEYLNKRGFDLNAVLLYTEADSSIGKWVRSYSSLLDSLSYKYCRIIVPEIYALPENKTASIADKKMENNRSVKYCRLLDIDERKIPCFIFLRKADLNRKIVYELNPMWNESEITEVMKSIFSIVYSSWVNGTFGDDQLTLIERRLKKSKRFLTIKRFVGKGNISGVMKLFVPFLK